ncbi:hypothetical protein E0F22_03210 [Weissella confusa]|nr:hypothetical protein [Weissella confusa]
MVDYHGDSITFCLCVLANQRAGVMQVYNMMPTKKLRQCARLLDLCHCRTAANVMYRLYHEAVLVPLRHLDFKVIQPNIFLRSKWIWTMWWQGEAEAPQLVRANFERLRQVFGEENVVIVDKMALSEWLTIDERVFARMARGQLSITHLSDIVRMKLAATYGGLWIDATVAVSPAILNVVAEQKSFITLSSTLDDNQFVSKKLWTSWFIGGPAGHPLFQNVGAVLESVAVSGAAWSDYYLLDDLCRVFFDQNPWFEKELIQVKKDWMYEAFLTSSSGNMVDMLECWQTNTRWSIQKMTYKRPSQIAQRLSE